MRRNDAAPEPDAMRDMKRPHEQVEVWRVRTAGRGAAPEGTRARLSRDEIERAARLVTPEARARFLATRAALRTLLARHCGTDPGAIEFWYSPNGKPVLARGSPRHVHFSVSHAGDLALVALSPGGAVGVDVERVRTDPRIDQIADRLFDPATRRLLASLAPAERCLAFHHAWTQREAFVKAVGGTLFATRDPLVFRWPPPPDPDVQGGDDAEPWTVAPLDAGPGYVASIVIAGAAGAIITRDLDDEGNHE